MKRLSLPVTYYVQGHYSGKRLPNIKRLSLPATYYVEGHYTGKRLPNMKRLSLPATDIGCSVFLACRTALRGPASRLYRSNRSFYLIACTYTYQDLVKSRQRLQCVGFGEKVFTILLTEARRHRSSFHGWLVTMVCYLSQYPFLGSEVRYILHFMQQRPSVKDSRPAVGSLPDSSSPYSTVKSPSSDEPFGPSPPSNYPVCG